MDDKQQAEQIRILNAGQNLRPSRQIGFEHGQIDALEGKMPMTARQLSYHSEEYVRGYREGYASWISDGPEGDSDRR